MSTTSFDDVEIKPAWAPHTLPDAPQRGKCSVWEPPILDYFDFIGEVFEKKKEGVMNHIKNDVVETTKILDVLIEINVSASTRVGTCQTWRRQTIKRTLTSFRSGQTSVRTDWRVTYNSPQ